MEVWPIKEGLENITHIRLLMIILKQHMNLRIFQFYLLWIEDQSHQTLKFSMGKANQYNLNLNEGEKKLLILHSQLVHIGFGKIKYLSHNG